MKVMDTVPAGPQYCDQEGWSKGTGRHIHLVRKCVFAVDNTLYQFVHRRSNRERNLVYFCQAWHAVLAFESINGFYPRIHVR